MREIEVYRHLDAVPKGLAKREQIREGCLVLEGGGWRGLYTAGVLDALMEQGIAVRNTVGVSAGALFGLGYAAGQIGWGARIDLTYRNDPMYVGRGALLHEHSIMGFHYLFREIVKTLPMDTKRFRDKNMELTVEATSLETGKPIYFSKNSYSNIIGATIASASVPYVSRPIMLDGSPYLDGACSIKIPYQWAKEQGFEKIIVVRTRSRAYRQETKPLPAIAHALYHKYPDFMQSLDFAEEKYNEVCDSIQADEDAGRTYVIAPSRPVEVGKFEKDLDKLGSFYFMGYHETLAQIPAIRQYLDGE